MTRRADDDNPGRKTRERRRSADLDFLTTLRIASLDELRRMRENLASKRTPSWKKVAIERAIAKRNRDHTAPTSLHPSDPPGTGAE